MGLYELQWSDCRSPVHKVLELGTDETPYCLYVPYRGMKPDAGGSIHAPSSRRPNSSPLDGNGQTVVQRSASWL